MTEIEGKKTKKCPTDEGLYGHVCAEFDAAIKKLEKAKKLYSEGSYLDSCASVDKAMHESVKLEQAINRTIHVQKRNHVASYKSLTVAEKQKISSLNNRLTELEKRIKKEVQALTRLIDERINSLDNPFISEYNLLDIRIDFHLDDTDPDARGSSEILIGIVNDFTMDMLDSGHNWNGMPDAKDRDECYLLHSLKWHRQPIWTWHDLLRIGRISTCIVMSYENVLEPLMGSCAEAASFAQDTHGRKV